MNSYNKQYLDRIAREKGFVRDNLEKVMRLARILGHINNSNLLKDCLVLKGGTAINLTIFEMPRLSVDIDLDFARNCQREEMIAKREKVNSELLAYMASEGYALRPGSKSPHTLDSWVFSYTNAGGNPDIIKIEINYSDRCHVLPMQETTINIDFLDKICIHVLSPIELFASKLNALLGRAAVRDVYDVDNMIRAGLFASQEERDMLRRVLVFYLAVGSSCKAEEVSLEFGDFKHIEGLKYQQVLANLLPVLNRKEHFDMQQTKDRVLAFLKDFLHFSENEQKFIHLFNKREYHPEVLFGEGDIAERTANHPMALWKCRPR